MKKSVFTILWVLLFCLKMTAEEVNGINYLLNSKTYTAEVKALANGYSGDIIIPPTITVNDITYSVTSIGSYAFNKCTNLYSVNVPEGVTTINEYAFQGCENLYKLSLPSTLKYIKDYAFSSCSSLDSLKLNNTLETIGEMAFYGCSNLSEIIIPTSVTSMGKSAFLYCRNLTSITIPEGITSISEKIFSHCDNLTDITIPSSVERIGDSAFEGCKKLKNVTILDGVKSIGIYAFLDCTGLECISIPPSITSISSGFNTCTNLKTVNISDLGAWCSIAFSDYNSNPISYSQKFLLNGNEVIEAIIPEGIERISNYAFYRYDKLLSVTLPEGIKYIGGNAFTNSTLESINFPASLKSIGTSAFRGCGNLKDVTLPIGLTDILSSAFKNCTSISSIIIPNGVTVITPEVFYGCSGLTSASIPSSISSVQSKAFANCINLKNFYCYAENLPNTASDAFDESFIEYSTLYVPDISAVNYQTTSPWSNFGTIVTIEGGNEPEIKKCEKPKIFFFNGKVQFECETENVEFISRINVDSFSNEQTGNEVNIKIPFTVSVFARRDGYLDSDTATVTINIASLGDLNGDGQVTIADVTSLVNVLLGK